MVHFIIPAKHKEAKDNRYSSKHPMLRRFVIDIFRQMSPRELFVNELKECYVRAQTRWVITVRGRKSVVMCRVSGP